MFLSIIVLIPTCEAKRNQIPATKHRKAKTTTSAIPITLISPIATTVSPQQILQPVVQTTVPIITPTVTVSPSNSTPTSLKNISAMWVWSESAGIVNDVTKQNEFFSFVNAPHGDVNAKIDRIYLNGDSFDYTNNSNKTALHSFLKNAHNQGIAVEYLTGDSNWVITGNENKATARCEKMIAFNAETSDSKERYDGMHLDIEPYLAPGWTSNTGAGTDSYNDETEKNYLNILSSCKTVLKNSGQNTTLSADIPTWFAQASDIWNVITSASSPLNYITVMNYFDTDATFLYGYGGANISGGVGPNLKANVNIPMVFASETSQQDPASITFFEEGFGAMENVLNQAKQTFGSNQNFAGVAIHHYGAVKNLKS